MSPGARDETDSPIEVYLDELVAGLAGARPRELRQMLAEAEGHLRDDAAASVAGGMTQDAAESLAVQRFGSARVVAGAERDRLTTPLGVVARQLVSTLAFLGAVGAVAGWACTRRPTAAAARRRWTGPMRSSTTGSRSGC